MPRVLVVDDDAATRTLISLQLTSADIEVETASNGRGALDAVRRSTDEKRPFDIMILDIMMPEVSGWEVLEQVRGDPSLICGSVIVISGAVDWIQDLWYLDEYADVYVEKRVGFLQDVNAVVRRVLEEREAASGSGPPDG